MRGQKSSGYKRHTVIAFRSKTSALAGLTKLLDDPDEEYEVKSIVIFVDLEKDHSGLKDVLDLAQNRDIHVDFNILVCASPCGNEKIFAL